MYVSLHNRSCYSFELALTRPDQLADFAARHGMSAMALTDRDGLYGAVGFQQACERAGIRPIFGVELTLAQGLEVTLLAQTSRGYANLCRLASLRHLGGAPLGARKVCEHAGDVVCLVGKATSEECRMQNAEWETRPAPRQQRKRTESQSRQSRSGSDIQHSAFSIPHSTSGLREAFENRLYVELAIHRSEDVAEARRRARWADEAGLAVVASCASRCLQLRQDVLLKALASIGTLTLLDQPHPDKPEGRWHLRTPGDMQRLFARRPDALRNTLVIAEQCAVALELGRNRFPPFASPDGRGAIDHLRELAVAGCRRRYVDEPPFRNIGGRRATLDEALARLERELAIIEQVHYAEYFLVFHEIVEHCRREGIATLARGSAADSLVCYALGVSHACPFRFDLPFDRFINPERAKFSKMADIDLDLPWDRRDEVVRWVYDRWGHERVAMIGSPNTFHARAAVADLGKVYGLPPHEVHRTTRLLPHVTSWNLPEAIRQSPEARDVPVHEEPYRTILQLARELDGLPRHWSMHPCGLVVAPEPLCDLVPVQRSPKGPLVAQYDMHAIEDLGFVKVDLLGQAGLSVLRDAVESINVECRMKNEECRMRNAECGAAKGEGGGGSRHHSAFSIQHSSFFIQHSALPIDLARDVDFADPSTWELIASGNARGVHHIESPAMTSLLQQCNCRDIDCLTTVVAIIRPGAANQGKKEAFARRHQGMEAPQFAHPSLVPVLQSTYGLMVFEEHILQIAVEFAGMNLGRADVLRRALNKEDRVLIARLRGEFWSSGQARGRRRDEIEAVWGLVEGFAGFMFNKAHSAEYAIEAFQGAWLKLRYPAHYIAAILSNYRGFYAHSPTLPQILYVLEALRLGIGFLPPCVNRSGRKFSVAWVSGADAEAQMRLARPPVDDGGRGDGHCGAISARPGSVAAAPPPPTGVGGSEGACAIRVPVSHIQGLSAEFLDRYHEQRERGAFGSPAEFVERCRPGEAEAQVLLDSGALDVFGLPRPAMFWQLSRLQRRRVRGLDMLWGDGQRDTQREPPVELTAPDRRQRARREMDLLGFPISIDPLTFLGMDDKGAALDESRYTPVAKLGEQIGRRVTVCGLMVADRINATQSSELMKFVTFGDRTGFIEAILFPDAYQRFGHLTAAHPILEATGVVEPFENGRGWTLRVDRLSPPQRRSQAGPLARRTRSSAKKSSDGM